MSMVAQRQRIGSAYVVFFGPHGTVSQYARERGACRQWIYREADWVQRRLADQVEIQRLRQELRDLKDHQATLTERLTKTVEVDVQKQAEFACVCQALGVSLAACWLLLDVLIPGRQQSVATLGRCTKAAGKRAGELKKIKGEEDQSKGVRFI